MDAWDRPRSPHSSARTAFGIYRQDPGERDHLPVAIMVCIGQIAAIEGFVYPDLHPLFGLPASV